MPRTTSDVIEELRATFIRRTLRQREQLQALTAAGITPASLPEVLHICHNLHGTAGVFDHIEIGERARQAEFLCKALAQAQAPDPRWKELAIAIDHFCDLIAALLQDGPTDQA